jgi:hypothetical protein
MTAQYEIPRIASGRTDAPDSLREALQAAAGDAPTSRDLAVLALALAPVFAVPPSALPPPVPQGLSPSASLGARLLGAATGKGATVIALAAVCAAGGGYGAYRWLGSSAPATHDIAPAPRVETASPVPAVTAVPVEQLPTDNALTEGAAATPPVRQREPSKTRTIETTAANPTHDDTASPTDAPKEMSEWALVELARRSLATDPKKALSLAEEHQKRFAGGPLSEEADFIEIEAVKRLGHADEARTLADRFKKRYPSSMHGQSVTVPPAPKP